MIGLSEDGSKFLHPQYPIGITPLPHWSLTSTSLVPHQYPSPVPHWSLTSTSLVPHPTSLVPHPYLAGPSPVPHWYLTSTSLVPHPYLTGPSPVPQWSLTPTSLVPHQHLTGPSPVSHGLEVVNTMRTDWFVLLSFRSLHMFDIGRPAITKTEMSSSRSVRMQVECLQHSPDYDHTETVSRRKFLIWYKYND